MLVAPQLEGSAYHRREPEKEVLYQVVADNLETFLELVRTGDHGIPTHVENELRRYLDCGILANGFVRLRCEDCGDSRVVAFSCKGRGFCPGCMGRRMADTAARLVDDVFPVVPVRQWVLSLPIELRYRLAYDGKLISDVLAVYLRAVNGWYRQQAKALGYTETRGGAVTFVQRFGSALNLNPHFHSLGLDGVYAMDRSAETPVFVPTPEPTDEDVQVLTETIAHRVIAMLERRGVLEDSYADALLDESPVLAGMTSASVSGLVAIGDRAGRRVRRVLSDPAEAIQTAPLCFSSRGFSLHAATRVEAEDRKHLERLCRYVARPPLASGRLTQINAEQLAFKLKTPWSDGTTHLILSPMELLEKLAALVPPPRGSRKRHHLGTNTPTHDHDLGSFRIRS